MKIKTKLQITTVSSIIAVIAFSVVVYYTAQEVKESNEEIVTINEIMRGVFELNIVTNDYLLHGGERARQQWVSKHDSISEALVSEELYDEHRAILDDIRQNLESIKTIFSQLVASQQKKKLGEEEIAVSQELRERLAGQISVKSQAMVSSTFQLQEAEYTELVMHHQRAYSLYVIFVAIVLAVGIIGSVVSMRGVSKPIEKFTEIINDISTGKLDVEIDTRLKDSKDEIGVLASSFTKMTGELKKSRDKIRKHNEELRSKVDELERFQKLTVGREQKMIELKERIKELEEELNVRKKDI